MPDSSLPAFVPPVTVQVTWGREPSSQALQFGRQLYATLSRDPDVDPVRAPGPGIPVFLGRDPGLIAKELNPDATTLTVLVPILDLPAYRDEDSRRALEALIAAGKAAHPKVLTLPVILHQGWAQAPGLAAEELLWSEATPEWNRPWTAAISVALAICEALQGVRLAPVRIFVSAPQQDRSLADRIVKGLTCWLKDIQVGAGYLDAARTTEHPGLAAQIGQATGGSMLLWVRTDTAAESPRCQQELLIAKERTLPIVTLSRLVDGERRATSYDGNLPVLPMKEGWEARAGAACILAWLQILHFPRFVDALLRFRIDFPVNPRRLCHPPELLDLDRSSGARSRASLIVHPDPPLSNTEIAVLRKARPRLSLTTPSTLFGPVLLENDPTPPLAGLRLSLSLSQVPTLGPIGTAPVASGLSEAHLEAALQVLTLTCAQAGAVLAYGGDLRKDSFTGKISDIIAAHNQLGSRVASPILSYVFDNRDRTEEDRVVAEYRNVEEDPAWSEMDGPTANFLRHVSMRNQMAEENDALICLGGKTLPAERQGDFHGYTGPFPGVIEEAWRHLQRQKPLFLVGGFGGAAALLAQLIHTGEVPEDLDEDWLQVHYPARATLAARCLEPREGSDPSPISLARMVQDVAAAGEGFRGAADDALWTNGLTKAENLRLFHATHPVEIAHLVVKGLSAGARKQATDKRIPIRLFPGDPTRLPKVEAYGVACAAGMGLTGDDAILNLALGGRLASMVNTGRSGLGVETELLVESVGVDGLAGDWTVLFLLAGSKLYQEDQHEDIKAATTRLLREAQRLGIRSIAVAPFPHLANMDREHVVKAMVQGILEASCPEVTLVLCVSDRDLYTQFVDRFAPREGPRPKEFDFVELPADPATAPSEAPTPVHLVVRAHQRETCVEVETFLVPPPGRGAAALQRWPSTVEKETWLRWTSSRAGETKRRSPSIQEGLDRGLEMAGTILADDLTKALQALAEHPLTIVTDRTGAELPWELLALSGGEGEEPHRPAPEGGLSRRILLPPAARIPHRLRRPKGGRLRVLLVTTSPADLKAAELERKFLIECLDQRKDIDHDVLDPQDVTVEAVREKLRTKQYDILHFSGHGEFEPKLLLGTRMIMNDGDAFKGDHLHGVHIPSMVFANACESGRLLHDTDPASKAPSIEHGLAEGFLAAGVQALIGTFWPVDDAAAGRMSAILYAALVDGLSLGEGLRKGRKELLDSNCTDWGNFLLYGDESIRL